MTLPKVSTNQQVIGKIEEIRRLSSSCQWTTGILLTDEMRHSPDRVKSLETSGQTDVVLYTRLKYDYHRQLPQFDLSITCEKLTLTGDREDKVELNKLNASIKQLYIKLKREAWSGLFSNVDAKTPNTKLWKLAQSLSYNQPQNMPCNTVLTSDDKAAPDDKTAANVLGEFYKGVGNLKFNQNDVILKK
ncbi:hypothetical protein TNCV_2418191 [Trichonephila clavipes]|nr:hypothetical protein TNCV_2418191 [Trichonephila clavipes]